MDRVVITKMHAGKKRYVMLGGPSRPEYNEMVADHKVIWTTQKDKAISFPSETAASVWFLTPYLTKQGAQLELVWFPD